MEVNQPQAVAHVILVEQFKGLEQLRTVQSELACVATAFFPFAAA
jgi:hypothetical protein